MQLTQRYGFCFIFAFTSVDLGIRYSLVLGYKEEEVGLVNASVRPKWEF